MPSFNSPAKLTPSILKHHGITYYETVIDSHDLDHVDDVRKGLLDFRGILTREVAHSVLLDDRAHHTEIPPTAFRESGRLEKLDKEIQLDFLLTAKSISYKTRGLQSDLAQEAEWQDLFKETIFKAGKDPRGGGLFAGDIS